MKRLLTQIQQHCVVWCAVCSMLCLLGSCRKDLGNYTYSELPQLVIDTTGSPGPFRVKQYIEELVITPKVIYEGQNSLEYYWIRSRYLDGVNDTISREKDLRMTVDFVIANSGIQNAHSLFFQVKEKETGRSEFVEYKLFVSGVLGKGLIVAHERDGTSDLDFIENPLEPQSPVTRNVYGAINMERLPGTVTGLRLSANAGVFVATDQSVRALDYNGMKLVLSDDELFGSLLHPEPFNPQGVIGSTYFVNDGILYYFPSNSPIMSTRFKMMDGSPYKLSPNIESPLMVFDELNGRFLTASGPDQYLVPFPDANPSARFSLNNIQKRLLHANTGFTLASSWSEYTTYAVFEDFLNPSSKSLYVFNYRRPLTPDYALVDISHVTDIDEAFVYQTIGTVPVIYYSTPEKIYLLQINPAGNVVVEAGVQFTAPAGEEITAFFKENDTYCYIATYEASTGKGKVYLMERSTGTGLFNSTPLKTWADFDGRITYMQRKTT